MKYCQEPEHKFQIDARDTMYPSTLTVFHQNQAGDEHGTPEGTVLGYVLQGGCRVETKTFSAKLKEGGFFAAPGGARFDLSDGGVLVCIERFGFKGMPLAGQREKRGRLSYIDGCSDSMLIPMARQGDCCLNHLHFPPGINQTQHIHPSIRLGIVCDGEGESWYEGHWQRDPATGAPVKQLKAPWKMSLKKGGVFLLEEQEQHSFRTFENEMHVIAYHPDSDTGPTDFNHAMLNRTYINHGKR